MNPEELMNAALSLVEKLFPGPPAEGQAQALLAAVRLLTNGHWNQSNIDAKIDELISAIES
jgi:hypothetical protein